MVPEVSRCTPGLLCTDTNFFLLLCRCRAFPHELDKAGTPRFREHTEALAETFSARELWDVFGIVDAVKVRTLNACISYCAILTTMFSRLPATFLVQTFTSF